MSKNSASFASILKPLIICFSFALACRLIVPSFSMLYISFLRPLSVMFFLLRCRPLRICSISYVSRGLPSISFWSPLLCYFLHNSFFAGFTLSVDIADTLVSSYQYQYQSWLDKYLFHKTALRMGFFTRIISSLE